jgi:hypothetical protein
VDLIPHNCRSVMTVWDGLRHVNGTALRTVPEGASEVLPLGRWSTQASLHLSPSRTQLGPRSAPNAGR